jgi:hypothetical protein
MNIDEKISKIIANYVMGDISTAEEEILQKWLTDPYNDLLFRKIVDRETVSKELMKLEVVDTNKAYKIFKQKTQKRIGFIKVLEYAAILLLPLGIGLAIFYYSDVTDYTQNITKQYSFDDEKITVVEQDGKHHTFIGNDTIVDLSDSKLLVKGDHIQYEQQSESKKEQIVYNTINIPVGKRYKLKLSDKTIVHLNSKTTMKYPVEFSGKIRNVQLVSGEAFFEVAKNDKPFILNFGTSKIKVLGTKFNVKSYGVEKYEHVTLEEGSISLNNSKNEIQMVPNQQVVIDKNDLSMKIEIVDAGLYSAWRTGFLNYKEEKLSAILSDLERQYDIKLFYQNQDVKSKKLSISINTNKNIKQILGAIEATGDVMFEMKNNNVIVMKK